MAEVMEFMPNGDVTLIITRLVKASDGLPTACTTPAKSSALANPQPLIDHDGPDSAMGAEPRVPPRDEIDDTVYYAPDPPGAEDGPLYPPPPRAARGSDASSRRDRSASPPAAFWASLRRNPHAIDPIDDDDDDELRSVLDEPAETKVEEEEVVGVHEVHCVASSMHLMLASEYFRTMLGGDSKEAAILKTKGHITIRLKIDVDTMVILLNIIHGASRKVPRQVALESLTQLAILAKGLGMLEAVEFFSDTWIDNLTREGFPKVYNDRVLPFMFVFWVFNRQVEFADMTKLAERESTDKLQDDVKDLPISKEIIDAIKNARQKAMQAAIALVHTQINRYLEGRTLCDGSLDDELRYACDAMILGSLLKTSSRIGIWPLPDAPFSGWKFKNLARKIRAIRILDVCNKSSGRRWTSHGPGNNSHGLEEEIEESIKALEGSLEGLKLSDYARNSEDLITKFHELLGPTVEEELGQVVEDSSNALINFQEENVDEQGGSDTGSRYDFSTQSKLGPELQVEEEVIRHLEAEDAQAEFDALMKPRHRMHWEEEFIEPHVQNRDSQDELSVSADLNGHSSWEDEAIELERETSQDRHAAAKPKHQVPNGEDVAKPLEFVETLENDLFTTPSKRRSQAHWEEDVPDHDRHQRNKVPRYKYPAVPERKSSIGKEDDWFKAQRREETTQKDYAGPSRRETATHNDPDTYDANNTFEIVDKSPDRLDFPEDRAHSRHREEFARVEENKEAHRAYDAPRQVLHHPREQRLGLRADKRYTYNGYSDLDRGHQPGEEEDMAGSRDNRRSFQNGYITPERQVSPRSDSIKRKELAREQPQTNGFPREYTRSPLRTEVPLHAKPSPPVVEKLKQEARVEPKRSRGSQQPQQTRYPSDERLVIQETLNEFIARPRQSTQDQLQPAPIFPSDRSEEFQGPFFGEVKQNPKQSPRQSPTLTHVKLQETRQPHVEEDKITPRQSSRQSLLIKDDKGPEIEKSHGDEIKVHSRPSPKHSPTISHRSIPDPVHEQTPRHSPTLEFHQPTNQPPFRNPPSPLNARNSLQMAPLPVPDKRTISSEKVHSTPSRDHQIFADRKVNIVPYFPESLRNEVKSPVHELFAAPKLGSIEEVIEKLLFPTQGSARQYPVQHQSQPYPEKSEGNAHQSKAEAKDHTVNVEIETYPAKTDAKLPKPESREVLKDKNVTDNTTTVNKNILEDDEHDLAWAQSAPPKNFKIRKSKKTFTTRY